MQIPRTWACIAVWVEAVRSTVYAVVVERAKLYDSSCAHTAGRVMGRSVVWKAFKTPGGEGMGWGVISSSCTNKQSPTESVSANMTRKKQRRTEFNPRKLLTQSQIHFLRRRRSKSPCTRPGNCSCPARGSASQAVAVSARLRLLQPRLHAPDLRLFLIDTTRGGTRQQAARV